MNPFTVLLTQPLANGLILFYQTLGNNLGFAIIAFSLFLKFITNPLTKPYMDSMKKIKDLAPQVDKLKKKHKGNQVAFAKAQADLYKEKKINPGAGCLPYILQIAVLIAFFNMFATTLSGANPAENFNKLLYPPLQFAPGDNLNTRFLHVDLTQPDRIPVSGIPFPLPGPILILSAIFQFLSAKIMAPYTKVEEKVAKKTKESMDDLQVSMQQSMIYTFPLLTLVVGLNFASGLALYWLVFTLAQVYQQVKTQGWGGLTPWLTRLNLIKSEAK